MTYALIGELTLGACVPIALEAQAAVVPALEAKIAGLLDIQAALTVTPPTIAGQLAAAIEMVANLDASPPSASIDLAGVAALLAEARASLSAWIAIGLSLGTPGLYAYTYEGTAGGLIPGGIPKGGTGAHVNAVIFIASDGGTWTAMQSCFATGGA
jgi:hypothetical protein